MKTLLNGLLIVLAATQNILLIAVTSDSTLETRTYEDTDGDSSVCNS